MPKVKQANLSQKGNKTAKLAVTTSLTLWFSLRANPMEKGAKGRKGGNFFSPKADLTFLGTVSAQI